MEDLAELAVPELLDIVHHLSEDEAAQLIMIAREPWFAEAEEADAESAWDEAKTGNREWFRYAKNRRAGDMCSVGVIDGWSNG